MGIYFVNTRHDWETNILTISRFLENFSKILKHHFAIDSGTGNGDPWPRRCEKDILKKVLVPFHVLSKRQERFRKKITVEILQNAQYGTLLKYKGISFVNTRHDWETNILTISRVLEKFSKFLKHHFAIDSGIGNGDPWPRRCEKDILKKKFGSRLMFCPRGKSDFGGRSLWILRNAQYSFVSF